MKEDREHELLNRWMNGEIDEEELHTLFSEEDILKYKQILFSVDQLVPATTDADLFDSKTITQRPKAQKVRKLDWWVPVSVAASIAILIVSGLLFLGTDETSYQTAFGEKLIITLPDETTTVMLAANSEISWDEDDWEADQRKVEINGKVYFDVSEKGAFEVQTPQGLVQVLGTQFDVDESEGFMAVNCYEGKVKTIIPDIGDATISAGERIQFSDGTLGQKESIVETEPTWMADLLSFKNAPLSHVIKSLAGEYGLEIDSSAINLNRRFSGTVPDDNMDIALKIVFDALDIKYKLEGKRLILSE